MKMMSVPGAFVNERNVAHHIEKTEKGYLVNLAVPGYTKERISIQVEADRLEVKSERDDSAIMFARPAFVKRFVLPNYADAEAIQARYLDGILQIEVPFRQNYRKEVTIA